jgi:thioredoxin 1
MLSLLRPLVLLALGLLLGAAPVLAQGSALATEKEPYSAERFAQLQAEGALILVDVWAEWCGTCQRQTDVLRAYLAEHPDVPLHVLTVDFDAQREAVRRFRAPRQSTLLLFQGSEQVWFSVAETKRDVIFAAINEAVASR